MKGKDTPIESECNHIFRSADNARSDKTGGVEWVQCLVGRLASPPQLPDPSHWKTVPDPIPCSVTVVLPFFLEVEAPACLSAAAALCSRHELSRPPRKSVPSIFSFLPSSEEFANHHFLSPAGAGGSASSPVRPCPSTLRRRARRGLMTNRLLRARAEGEEDAAEAAAASSAHVVDRHVAHEAAAFS